MSKANTSAYAIIKEEIVSGRFAPGARLKEDRLAAVCAVSRTPIREALRRLANEGLVVLSPNQGAQVALMGAKDLTDLYELRALVESYAAKRAATRISPSDIEHLKQLNREMESCRPADDLPSQRFAAANAEFHRVILKAADSARLLSVSQVVTEAPLSLLTFSRYSAAELDRSIQHHRELISAFEARDESWALSVMASHIQAASHTLTRRSPTGAGSGDPPEAATAHGDTSSTAPANDSDRAAPRI